jgi:hypothetical protein
MGEDGSTKIPIGLRVPAIILRALFVGALVAITVRVSTPQSETLWSVHETPGDLIKAGIGSRGGSVDRHPPVHDTQDRRGV